MNIVFMPRKNIIEFKIVLCRSLNANFKEFIIIESEQKIK